jgi:hypothetical protein
MPGFPFRCQIQPAQLAFLREPTAAAARRNGKNGFHKGCFSEV